MAAPSYTTDLTTIAAGNISTDTYTWRESDDSGWDDGGSMVNDLNLYYNGTACVSAQFTKTGVATIEYFSPTGVGEITVPTDGAILIHHLWAAPPALNTYANGGVIILVGNNATNNDQMYGWKQSGSDMSPAPKGGWANYAINPGIGSPDYTIGTPDGTWNVFGMAVTATAQARGNPHAVNAIRYGRCESIFTLGDLANGYATFAGYGAIDNSSTNRWNLIDPVPGGFQWQGLMSLGVTATSVDFRDSNVSINIIDTINVTSAFNAIEINHASSNIEWTAIAITALGTNSKGTFEVVDNATVAKDACTFTDMNSFTYQSNSTLTNTIYRRCGLVTQGAATFTGCTFDNASGTIALSADAIGDVTKCQFNSDGTGHAVDLGNVTTTQSMSWDNLESGYASTSGSTGNETILVNVSTGETLTINVAATGSTPTYKNDGSGTVSVVAGQKTFTVEGLELNTEVTIVTASTTTVLHHTENASTSDGNGKYKITYAHSGGASVDVLIHHIDYVPDVNNSYGLTLPSTDSSLKVSMSIDLNYENP